MSSDQARDGVGQTLRMDAYYYGFEPTGVLPIDRILSAVACAGKSFHHTEDWNDSAGGWGGKGDTPVEWIQNAANEAAQALCAATPAEPVAWASCPSCNGTGDLGGNPSYGMCPDCDGKGKLPAPAHPIEKEGVSEAMVKMIEKEARRIADFYPAGSDGRNTFVMFADWVSALAHNSQEGTE